MTIIQAAERQQRLEQSGRIKRERAQRRRCELARKLAAGAGWFAAGVGLAVLASVIVGA